MKKGAILGAVSDNGTWVRVRGNSDDKIAATRRNDNDSDETQR
jgi:hypothetical protein